MRETSLDRIVTEEEFCETLADEAEMLFRLTNTLHDKVDHEWSRRHLYQLAIEADLVESFLDDHGAGYNQSFCFLREIVASIRAFSQAGFSIKHLEYRLDSYSTHLGLFEEKEAACKESMAFAGKFVRDAVRSLLDACRAEAEHLKVKWDPNPFPKDRYLTAQVHLKLPRNLGEEMFEDEEQKVAEVASKYLQVCEMFQKIGIHQIEDEKEREAFLASRCSEERARVYEATVHNLQSAYDTHIKNTSLEARDSRLQLLRGHASAAFHTLEAVTFLAHFVERHETGNRPVTPERRITSHIDRVGVRHITLNHLLYWAKELIELGRDVARDVLSTFTNVQELKVEVPDELVVHARPASLIVGIVNHYGTPVEMEVSGSTCSAASILELMIAVGSNPNSRTYVFRGDENPLRDIRLLFEAGLGESGLSQLPAELWYLKGN